MPFYIIAAVDDTMGLGKNGDLAWRLTADLKHFKEITSTQKGLALKNVVIMGRKTWESLPPKFRPLPDRINIVLTHQSQYALPPEVLVFNDLDKALLSLSTIEGVGEIFVIGGANLYAQAINNPHCHGLFITRVRGDFQCDVSFPDIPSRFKLLKTSAVHQESALFFFFEEYKQ